MKKRFILTITIIVLFTTGCWNYRELNDMAIVGTIGLDYNDDNKEYEVSVQILNAKKTSTTSSSSTSSAGSPITVYKMSAKTIHEALRNLIYYSPKKLYIGHLKAVIVNENIAKEDILLVSDFLFRDPESRKDFNVLVAKDSNAYDIMSILTSIESSPDSNIEEKLITNSKYKGSIAQITFDEFLSTVYGNGIEGVIPTITVEGDIKKAADSKEFEKAIPDAKVVIKYLSVFKNKSLVGYLTSDESIGYSIMTSILKSSVISFKCNDEKYGSIEIIGSSSKIKVNTDSDVPKVEVTFKAMASISELNCAIDLKKLKNIDKVKDMASKELKNIIQKEIEATKKYNSDINGIGKKIYQNNTKYWNKVKNKWYDIFKDIDYKIKVNLDLKYKGSITSSVLEEEK